jgi:hypothetical protein
MFLRLRTTGEKMLEVEEMASVQMAYHPVIEDELQRYSNQGFSLRTPLRRLQFELHPCPLEGVFDVCGFRVG